MIVAEKARAKVLFRCSLKMLEPRSFKEACTNEIRKLKAQSHATSTQSPRHTSIPPRIEPHVRRLTGNYNKPRVFLTLDLQIAPAQGPRDRKGVRSDSQCAVSNNADQAVSERLG